jgi:hypothetical protein
VAEVPNPQDERFAHLLSIGVSQAEAYRRAGWKADKSNASKRAREPHIIERIAELQAEEAERVAKLRENVSDRSGYEELKEALRGAVTASQWSAAVTAARHLAEMDGSAEQVAPEKLDSVEEILKVADRNGPLWSLAVRVIARRHTGEATPDSDTELIERGLRGYLSARQLSALAQLLNKSESW